MVGTEVMGRPDGFELGLELEFMEGLVLGLRLRDGFELGSSLGPPDQ